MILSSKHKFQILNLTIDSYNHLLFWTNPSLRNLIRHGLIWTYESGILSSRSWNATSSPSLQENKQLRKGGIILFLSVQDMPSTNKKKRWNFYIFDVLYSQSRRL